MPANVEPLRPRTKAAPLPPRPGAHPVHSQVEILAQELNATMMTASATAPEPVVTAPEELPAVAMEEAAPAAEPTRVHPLPTAPVRPMTEPEARPRRFGLFGMRREKKQEAMRAEPQMNAAQPAESRATVQVMTRNASAQRTTPAMQANADDLFPDFKKEDQFEIPAFLRRQTN